MKFIAKATSQADFDTWVSEARKSPSALTTSEYDKLARPSQDNPASIYALAQADLYDGVVMKYMKP